MSLPPTDRKEKEKQLTVAIHAARSRHIRARLELHRLVNEIPSGTLDRDANQQLQKISEAGQEYRRSLKEYDQAVEAYTAFVIGRTSRVAESSP